GWRSPDSKMTFQTNGSVHHSGVANEHDTIALLNEHGVFAETVTHLGGTRNKADAMAGATPISIKHKAGLKNGSFDWVNTSQTDALLDSSRFDDFRAFVGIARNWGTAEREAIVTETRDLFNEVCSDALDSITSETLTAWLRSELIDANHGMSMVINDTAAQRCYIMGHDALLSARCLQDGWTAHLVSGKGMTSRRIVLKRMGQTIDTGLRLRVTSNNGIRAFLGLSKANRNSQVVLKLQQDKVAAMINDADAQVLCY
ncbi:MAG: hypothetical protein ACO27D_05975, partial [Candidatus Fonsibacter ubiquis]